MRPSSPCARSKSYVRPAISAVRAAAASSTACLFTFRLIVRLLRILVDPRLVFPSEHQTEYQVVAPDTLFGVRKKEPNEGSIIIRRSLTISLNINKQVVLLATAVCMAEIAGLKQDLERARGELGLTRR